MKNCVAQITLLVAVAFALTACARRPPTALPVGPDTFRITASHYGPAAAEESALGAAFAKCSSLGRELLVTNTSGRQTLETGSDTSRRNVLLPSHHFTAIFRCLEKGDPQLVRPTYQKSPDVLIEDRRR